MQQYLDLLELIRDEGTIKPPAREGMPGTRSIFGTGFAHNLADGFPLLTTKKMFWKGIVVELLWFLKGDTNIKYLVDNGVNIWNEDSYNYYKKIASKNTDSTWNAIYMGVKNGERVFTSPMMNNVDSYSMFTYEEFCKIVKETSLLDLHAYYSANGYTLGDCGYQYGKQWRRFGEHKGVCDAGGHNADYEVEGIDQIKNLIKGLRENPESRRHIVTAIDPLHDQDLALTWCHAMFQMNCRPLTLEQRIAFYDTKQGDLQSTLPTTEWLKRETSKILDKYNVPRYYLDCQLYQRSADVILGVPFNIASYALLTHILAEMCNMVPGMFYHTFGDVHLYDNHLEALQTQLCREPLQLPKLAIHSEIRDHNVEDFSTWHHEMFQIENYNYHPAIKAGLSTGLK